MTGHEQRLALTAAEIERLTGEAFVVLLRRIRAGEDPRTAIDALMGGFDERYRETLAAAFSDILGRAVGAAELRSYPVGEVVLSQRLYAHARRTSGVVAEVVRQHAAGWQSARDLALQLYEGYGFKDGDDPLQWPARSPKWPKYMRQAVTEDPVIFPQYRAIARKAAGKLKTEPLKAAYLEALDELEKGRGFDRLAKKLDVAFNERMRYFSNRIAQTELHRAWMDEQAREIMADDTIAVVRYTMSGTHPRSDICDVFAKMDKYGLGPGLYPKAKAPKPPLHPHCRCTLVSRRLISEKGAREKPGAEKAFLARLPPDEAAQMIGSRAKLQRILSGEPLFAVFNPHRPVPYRLGMVSGNVRSAYQIAREGGTNSGW